jgi:hypothetical protein
MTRCISSAPGVRVSAVAPAKLLTVDGGFVLTAGS